MSFTLIENSSNYLNKAMSSGMDSGIIKNQDSGTLEKLKELGANVQTTNITPEQLAVATVPAVKSISGVAVSGVQDVVGNFYAVDENSSVVKIDQGFNTPSLGVPGQVPTTPLGDTRIITNGNGGRGVPPIIPPGVPPNINSGGNMLGSGKIYTAFESGDIIPNQQEIVTRALWSNNVGNLLTYFTSSAQTDSQKRYYYELYNSSSGACNSEPQFSVAYGHKWGSGSADEGGQINDTPTRAVYSQMKQVCLDPRNSRFTIGGTTTDSLYSIVINRSRMREWLDEGNLEINLHKLSGSEYVAGGKKANSYTGSAVKLGKAGSVVRLIDDSTINPASVTFSGESYQIVSGSLEQGVYNPSNPIVFGTMYRRLGIVVLDANKLNSYASFGTVTGSEVPGDNAYKLFLAMSGAAKYTDASGDRLGFKGRSIEKVKSTHYFVRVKNGEYNFSNNPTFVTGSEGDLSQPSFINDPKTYITTIGLYNNNKELVAVAKVSKAIQKSFTKEALIKVKLDF